MVKRRRIVAHRRRREQKTDYMKRLTLLKSGKHRLVVRKSLNNLTCQIVDYKTEGDSCLVSADSRELKKMGWKANAGNIPAAYLTGFLCGTRAKKKKVSDAILDIGLYRSTKGSRVFAALKGALDAGLKVPHSEDVLPDEERSKGAHISAFADRLKRESSGENKERFSSYAKEKLTPESLPAHFDEVKGKILGSK